MAIPFVIPIITVIGTVLVNLANLIMQVVRTVASVPWRRIFYWAVFSIFIAYFSAVCYSLVTVSIEACRLVFGSSSMATGRPGDISGAVFSFSSFWQNLSLPPFWRFFCWFMGLDWYVWLAFNALHFWFVGYLLGRFARPIGTLIHKAVEAL